MVCSRILNDESLFAYHALKDIRFLDSPLSHVAKLLLARLGLLGSMRRRPSIGPIGGELLNKQSLDRGRLPLAMVLDKRLQ
jgi:hypothetical protein